MKKSKTDLFITFVPTREEPMGLGGWVNRCDIDSLQRGKNRGERTDNRKRCGVYRRLNTVLSTGWAKGCSLHMCHTHAHTSRVCFLQKGNAMFSRWYQIPVVIYGANPTSVKTLNFIARFLSNWFSKQKFLTGQIWGQKKKRAIKEKL